MTRVAIVTDSAADVDPSELAFLGVTCVHLDQETTEAPGPHSRANSVATLARVTPLTQAFLDVYEARAARADAILSLHVTARLADAVEAARAARAHMRGVLPIEIVDTGLASFALGFVVRRVARAARRGADLSELDLLARRAIQNVHAMFFAESVESLRRPENPRIAPISGNGTRPLVEVDHGEVRPLERVRTRARGLDRLAEFVELFPRVDELAILHDAPSSDLEQLIRRIEPWYPRDRMVVRGYGPLMRAQIGPHAIGVFVDQGIEDD